MPKITNRDVLTHFYKTFDINAKTLTKSQHSVNGARLKNLRKLVEEYIENNNISTDKSVNEIIIQVIDYSKIVGKQFKSISSLGYDVLPKSIIYWKKKETLENTQGPQELEELNDKLDQQIARNNENLSTNKKLPSWLDDSEDEYY